VKASRAPWEAKKSTHAFRDTTVGDMQLLKLVVFQHKVMWVGRE
jgi:hypothetical protein